MKFYTDVYSKNIPNRLISLRKKYHLTQSDVGNASQVSQIEKGNRSITNTILYDFKEKTGTPYSTIIFGELNEFVNDLFYQCFRLVLFKRLETVDKNLYPFYSEELVLIQSYCLELVSTFAHYNTQRKNFESSDESEMDTFHKKDDINIFVGEKTYNLARTFRSHSINESTVIDFEEMFEIIWLMLSDKLVNSFEINICRPLFELDEYKFPHKFKQENIDDLINRWLIEIVPNEVTKPLIKKLKDNPLFNIGYMIKEILDKMYKSDIPKSYLTSVPLIISKQAESSFGVSINNNTKVDAKEVDQVYKDYMTILTHNRDIDELYQKYPKEKLASLGIAVHEFPAVSRVEERTFDEIIQLVTNPYSTRPIQNLDSIKLEPTRFSVEDKNRIETMASSGMTDIEIANLAELYDINLDNPRVSRKIEGLLTNNSQVTYYFQEQLNKELLTMVYSLENVQKAFIRLLSREEIIRFSL